MIEWLIAGLFGLSIMLIIHERAKLNGKEAWITSKKFKVKQYEINN